MEKDYCKKIINYSLYTLVFVLPWFFLPWANLSAKMGVFNKQYLLWLTAFVLFLLFLAGQINKGKINLVSFVFDKYIYLFLLIFSVSSIFSVYRHHSFFGNFFTPGLTWLTLLSLIAVYWIISRSEKETVIGLFKTLIYGFFTVIVSASWWLIFIKINLFQSGAYIKDYFIYAFGSLEDLSLYLAIMAVFIIPFLLFKENGWVEKKWKKKLLLIFFSLTLFLLISINFAPAWLVFLAGSLFSLISFYNSRKKGRLLPGKKIITRLIILIAIPILFLQLAVFSSHIQTQRYFLKNSSLDYKNSFFIAKQAILNKPFFGPGPDTFGYAYSYYRQPSVNNTDFWQSRFNNSASFMLELGAVIGLPGLAFYLFLLFYIIYRASLLFGRKQYDSQNKKALVLNKGLAAGLIALGAAQLFYSSNLLLLFLFWVFLGILAANNQDRLASKKPINLVREKFPVWAFFSLLIIFLSFLWLAVLGFGIKWWTAKALYAKNQNSLPHLLKAAELNPFEYNYQIFLAQYYLAEVLALKANEADQANIAFLSQKTLDHARQAAFLSPGSVKAQENLAIVYRELGKIFTANQELTLSAFYQARQLEPTNPVLALESGKTFLSYERIEEATVEIKEAVSLKDEYYEADFYLAKAYLAGGQEDEAFEILNGLVGRYDDLKVFYEQGIIMYNQKNYYQAIEKLRQVVVFSPYNANAMYVLALALEKTGSRDEALHYLKKVLSFNPDNEEVRKKAAEIER